MKKFLIILVFLNLNLFADMYVELPLSKEQYYNLYHRELYARTKDIAENIAFLQKALKANFANPLYALTKIENKSQWDKYRYLFLMELNLKLLDSYLLAGDQFNKYHAYFYNTRQIDVNLESLNKAKEIFKFSLYYWEEAKKYASKASKYSFIYLNNLQNWDDLRYRIENKELDYADIIQDHIYKIEKVEYAFKNLKKQVDLES